MFLRILFIYYKRILYKPNILSFGGFPLLWYEGRTKGWKEFYYSGRENNPAGEWIKVIIII